MSGPSDIKKGRVLKAVIMSRKTKPTRLVTKRYDYGFVIVERDGTPYMVILNQSAYKKKK